MFKVEQHIWRTADGDLVPHGHPDAAFLAYPAGEEVADDIAKKEGLAQVQAKPKAAPAPEDKSVAKPADKGASRPAAK